MNKRSIGNIGEDIAVKWLVKNKNYNTLENSYFVLGDNRPFSKDSRIIGCVQKEDIKGVLKVITAHYNDVNDLSKGKKIVPFVYF